MKLTIKDLESVNNPVILLSRQFNKNYELTLKYHPDDLRYRVRYQDGDRSTSQGFLDPQDALDKYNEYLGES